MKSKMFSLFFSACILLACTNQDVKQIETKKTSNVPLQGTWQLLSSTILENGQETFSDYTKDQRMIKIINDTHFSFLKHDLKLNKEGKNNFDAGGGRYELVDDNYTEHLDFYNDKNWEGKSFNFKVKIENDTLIQTGVEKVESAGVDRTITEKYIKVKDN
ncbi:hypothetical protein [Pedobacter nyackensis]|uniref:hypothetical protein n=1 Tax=Pedobacter nyackensis TaxID=475255 RepID=UPI002930EE8C|nr:hypothetical protein [Pedobacter nyackensis]